MSADAIGRDGNNNWPWYQMPIDNWLGPFCSSRPRLSFHGNTTPSAFYFSRETWHFFLFVAKWFFLSFPVVSRTWTAYLRFAFFEWKFLSSGQQVDGRIGRNGASAAACAEEDDSSVAGTARVDRLTATVRRWRNGRVTRSRVAACGAAGPTGRRAPCRADREPAAVHATAPSKATKTTPTNCKWTDVPDHPKWKNTATIPAANVSREFSGPKSHRGDLMVSTKMNQVWWGWIHDVMFPLPVRSGWKNVSFHLEIIHRRCRLGRWILSKNFRQIKKRRNRWWMEAFPRPMNGAHLNIAFLIFGHHLSVAFRQISRIKRRKILVTDRQETLIHFTCL